MKRLIILAVMLTAGLSACDILDKEPLDKISQFDYFKNATDLELFTNPLYNNLLNKSPFDEQSDILVQNTLSAIIGGSPRTVPNSGGGWSWGDLRRINTLLEFAHQCNDEEAVTKYTAIVKFFRAFFYFEKVKRFGDVPWYGKTLGSADAELYNPRDSRELILSNMIKDIDEAINSGGLTEKVSPYRVNKWAALALKAQFCLYEGTYRKYHNINLEGNDYRYYLELAATAAKTIIDEGPYSLYQTKKPETDYMMLFVQDDANRDEYILAIDFDYEMVIRHNAAAYTLQPTQGRPGFTRKFINTYLMKDGTAFTNKTGWQTMSFKEEMMDRDPRLAQSIRTPGYTRIGQKKVLAPDLSVTVTGYQPIKFVQDPTTSKDNVDRVTSSDCDLPVYRYAEVLLIYAEAKAELGTLTQGDLDISVNKLRDRVKMPYLMIGVGVDRYLSEMYPNVNGGQKGEILEIRRERTIELVQEGQRLNDLFRWKAGSCIDQPITGMYLAGPGSFDLSGDDKPDLVLYPEGGAKPDDVDGIQVYELNREFFLDDQGYVSFHKGVARTAFNEGRDYLYPIPINERSLNPNLTQNPGWSDGLDF